MFLVLPHCVSNTWYSLDIRHWVCPVRDTPGPPSLTVSNGSLLFVTVCLWHVVFLVIRHCICRRRDISVSFVIVYVGHVVCLVTRHCVWNVWYSLSLSLPVSSKCYSLSFITNCIQLVLAWHARPNVLFSYRTCSCFSAATLQPYATQTSLISVSVRSFPSPSSASSSFSVSSTYLSLTFSGLTGIWLSGLVWDCGLFWFVLM